MLSLPPERRAAFKSPIGPVLTDVNRVCKESTWPLIAVGDIVSYELTTSTCEPDVAIIDGLTERSAVAPEIETALEELPNRLRAENPPGKLTHSLLNAVTTALETTSQTTIVVDGEEDLAALPALIAAPQGATVIYGQPGEGMVRVSVDSAAKSKARSLFHLFEGDVEKALSKLTAAT